MNTLQIRTFGTFSLTAGDNTISNQNTRSKKVWHLLAYLIQYRGIFFSQQQLIDQFWGEDSSAANPENALRITLHRLRSLLDRLWPGAGHALILYRDGGYGWNGAIPAALDCEAFEALCRNDDSSGADRLDRLMSALALYRGAYLPHQASELWAIPLATHYSSLFLTASMEAAEILLNQSRPQEAAAICRTAAAAEPYHEPLHTLFIRALAAAGDPKSAVAVYEELSRRLFDEFGILPGEEIRGVYRCIAGAPEDRTLPMEEVLEHLQENTGRAGAMQCDYDHFKVLCHANSRSLERTGSVTHVALLRVSGGEKPLSSRSLHRIMDFFGETLRKNLRRGDIISRCSTCQYIIMLPEANYENSCMVCRRLIAAFRHRHPHIAAEIHFLVQPLTPATRVP